MIMDLYDGDYQSHWVKLLPTFNQTQWINEVYTFARRVLRGLMVMHSNNIVHKDLKQDNIFVKTHPGTSTLNYAIGDFGLSEKLIPGFEGRNFSGCIVYMSPELINGIGYTTKTDIWSLGIILYEMITLESPFSKAKDLEGVKWAQMYQPLNYNHKNFVNVFNPYSNVDFKKMIKESMLVPKQSRLSAKDIYSKYFAKLDKKRFLHEGDFEDDEDEFDIITSDESFVDSINSETKIPMTDIINYLKELEREKQLGLRTTVTSPSQVHKQSDKESEDSS